MAATKKALAAAKAKAAKAAAAKQKTASAPVAEVVTVTEVKVRALHCYGEYNPGDEFKLSTQRAKKLLKVGKGWPNTPIIEVIQ